MLGQKGVPELLRVIVRMIIAVAGLLFVPAIVSHLPMVNDLGTVLAGRLSVAMAVTMAIDALIIYVLLEAAFEIRSRVAEVAPQLRDSGTIVSNALLLGIIGIAYTRFKPLAATQASLQVAYTWIFLGLAAVPLVIVVVRLFQSVDLLTAALLSSATAKHVANGIGTPAVATATPKGDEQASVAAHAG
jgi:hypothetical protein